MHAGMYICIISASGTGSVLNVRDTCKGDSGGPLMWKNPNTQRYTIVGNNFFFIYKRFWEHTSISYTIKKKL